MAGWNSIVTKSGAALLAAAFGKMPNISRVAWGSGNVPDEELEFQTDVTDFVKNLSLLPLSSDGAETIIRAQLTNQGLTQATLLSQLGVFATLDGGGETLLAIHQTDTPSTIASAVQQAGYAFEPEIRIIHANVAGFTATIDWGAFVSLRTLQESIDAAMSQYGGGIELTANEVPQATTKMFLHIAQDVTNSYAIPDFSGGGGDMGGDLGGGEFGGGDAELNEEG